MKFLKILFVGFLIMLIMISISIFIFIKTFNINRFKPQIIKQVTQAFGREVQLEEIGLSVSISQGVAVHIRGLRVAGHQAFSEDNFINIKSIRMGIDVRSFILNREVRVSRIDLESVRIVIIRDEKGRINAQTLAVSQKNNGGLPATPPQNNPPQENPPTTQVAVSLPFKLLIQSFQIKDATIVYIDRMLDPNITVEFSNVNVDVRDFSLNEACDVSLEASLFSRQKNIKAKGQLIVDSKDFSVVLRGITIDSDLSDLSLPLLEKSLPMVQPAGFKDNFEGRVHVDIDKVILNQTGLAGLILKSDLSSGRVSFKQPALSLTNISADFDATEKDLQIKKSSMTVAGGAIAITGRVADYLKNQAFSGHVTLNDLDLNQLVPKVESIEFQGKMSGQFTVNGQGFAPDAIAQTLSGKGTLEIKEGKLVNINVLQVVLDKISMLPKLVDKLNENLPEKYKEKLKEKDTAFSKIQLNTTIAGKNISLDDAEITSDVFTITGQGNMSFDQRLTLEAGIRIPQDLSQSMVATSQGLEYLLEDTGEIFIPIKISGKVPALAFFPDVEYLGKKILMNKGREELNKILEKVFKRDEAPQESPQPPDGSAPQPSPQEKPQKSPEQELIEGILDQIFR